MKHALLFAVAALGIVGCTSLSGTRFYLSRVVPSSLVSIPSPAEDERAPEVDQPKRARRERHGAEPDEDYGVADDSPQSRPLEPSGGEKSTTA